jgi:pimeloyl-ACP methyl ester carboxylesterase
LQYFARPLAWLRSQPEIDPDRVWIAGVSAGTEAAALVAADRPNLVHGLLVLAPSSVAHCSFSIGCPTPAWLRDGQDVPATGQFDMTTPTDTPGSAIKVERIRGPVVAVCGDADLIWDSCRYAAALFQRRHGRAADHRDLLLSYPDAGHGLILLAPFVPRLAPPVEARMSGSTPTANDEALADAWPRIVARIRDN